MHIISAILHFIILILLGGYFQQTDEQDGSRLTHAKSKMNDAIESGKMQSDVMDSVLYALNEPMASTPTIPLWFRKVIYGRLKDDTLPV